MYQHQSGQEYLFRAHGQAWAIGASPGGLRVGIIAFSNSTFMRVPSDDRS